MKPNTAIKILIMMIMMCIGAAAASAITLTDAIQAYEFENDNSGATGDWKSDLSGNGKDLTDVTTTANRSGIIGDARFYNDDYIDVADEYLFIDNNNWTIIEWINMTTSGSSECSWFEGNSGADNYWFCILIEVAASGGDLKLFWQTDGNDFAPDTGTNIRDSAWHHIVVRRAGNLLTAHVDGEIVISQDVTGVGSITATKQEIGRLGRASALYAFSGTIDELYIYNDTLPVGLINTSYNGGAGYQPYASAASIDVNITSPSNYTNFTAENTTINVTFEGSTDSGQLVSCNMSVNGALNQSGSSINLTAGSWFSFGITGDEGQEFNISVECNHSGVSSLSEISFLYGDTIIPSVNIYSPLNGSSYIWETGNVTINASCTDANLYRVNLTIRNNTGDIVYSASEENIAGTSWSNYSVMPSADFSSNTSINQLQLVCADAHTTEILKEVVDPEKNALNEVYFPFKDDPMTIVIEHSGELTKFDPVQESDRWIFDTAFMSPQDEIVFRIYSQDFIPVQGSDYKCHGVIGNHWFDAEIDGAKSCVLKREAGYWSASVTMSKAITSFESKSVGELNIVNQTISFTTQNTTAVDAITWDIECGEKYPDNTYNLSFDGQGLTNCTLHVNDFLYDDWNASCQNIIVETNLGKQEFSLEAVLSNGTAVTSTCRTWNDKLEKDISDFLWFSVIMLVIAVFIWIGSKGLGIFWVVGGLMTIWLGYAFFAYHWVLGSLTIIAGCILALWAMIGDR